MKERLFQVSEIFGPTIQGEGAQIGRPTVFIRFGGCDYRCSWCDSLYAVLPEYRKTWEKMTANQILDKVSALAGGVPILITLSGGNPAIQTLSEILDKGHDDGHEFTMETQGSVAQDWFKDLDHLCLSPKPPSSGMETDWDKLQTCIDKGPLSTILKVVVFDDLDFEYAMKVREMGLLKDIPLYLQVGNLNPAQNQQADISQMLTSLEALAKRCNDAKLYDVRVLPQLHALIWGNKRAV